MSFLVTVQGKAGSSVVATNGDTINLSVGAAPAASAITFSPAGSPGGQGPVGPQGPPSTTIGVGAVSTLPAGSNATVSAASSNNGANLTLNFGLPVGNTGPAGITPTLSVGNVTTGAAGSSALVVATASNGGANVLLDFTIPRGDPGTDGANGTSITLSSATPANLGVAAAGTSNLAARADHVHALPVIAYGNLSGVPSNFPTNTTLVSGLSAGYSAINHAHNYVTSLNGITGALTLAAGPNVTISSSNLTLTIDSVGGLGANDPIDGGDYVGIVRSVTITSQPFNVTVYPPATVENLTLATASTSVGGDLSTTSGRLLAFGGSPERVMESTNGTSWTSLYSLPSGRVGNHIVAAGNVIVAYSHYTDTTTATPYNQVELFTSTDAGVSWVKSLGKDETGVAASTVTGHTGRRGLAYGGGVYVAMTRQSSGPSNTSTQAFYTSPNGLNWTVRQVPQREGVLYGAVTYGAGKFVAVGGSVFSSAWLGASAVSVDGSSWSKTDAIPFFSADFGASIAFGNGRFVSISNQSAAVSLDGVTWTTHPLPIQMGYSWGGDVVFTGSVFCVFARNSSAIMAVSSDGQSWSLVSPPSGSAVWGAAANVSGNVLFLANTRSSSVAFGTVGVASTASATLTATAEASIGVASYQWQLSTDAGATWSNIAGATSSTLSLTGLTTADSGTRYRAAVSATGATTVYSQSAVLTVTG